MNKSSGRIILQFLEGISFTLFLYLFACYEYAESTGLEYSLTSPWLALMILAATIIIDYVLYKDSTSTLSWMQIMLSWMRILFLAFMFVFIVLNSKHSLLNIGTALFTVSALVFRMVVFLKLRILYLYTRVRRALVSILCALVIFVSVAAQIIMVIRPEIVAAVSISPDEKYIAKVEARTTFGLRDDTHIYFYENQKACILPFVRFSDPPVNRYFENWIDINTTEYLWIDNTHFCVGEVQYSFLEDDD